MRRFSIRGLMGFVVAVAFGVAALRNANAWWAGSLLLATLVLLGYSILAIVHGQGKAAWLGFLVGCGGYFLAVRALPEPERGWLPTSRLLLIDMRSPNIVFGSATGVAKLSTSFAPVDSMTEASAFVRSSQPRPLNGSSPSILLYNALLPGAASPLAFRSIGNSLFALLFGWFGAAASRRMRGTEAARIAHEEHDDASRRDP